MCLMSNLFIVYDMLTVFSHVSVRLVEAGKDETGKMQKQHVI